MRKILPLVSLHALVLAACFVPVPAPKPPVPPAVPDVTFDTVSCAAPAHVDHCDSPVSGATVRVDDKPPRVQVSNKDGYISWTVPASLVDTFVTVDAPGWLHYDSGTVHPADLSKQHNIIQLAPSLPAPPSRAAMLDVRLTFQGLTVHTQQFGDLPWFEAALPWLSAADRASAYAAKHASTAWPGGDTHALIALPSGPPLYDEPGQPYSADRFGPLDWTAGNTHVDGRLANLVVEVARAGFNRQLLFLGGDDGERGFPIAMAQLDLVHDALLHSPYGDLRGYVVPLPGWDGVFYGYTPQHVFDWGAKCRTLFPYCGIEHSTGHIPTGEGDGDWTGNGGMRSYDLLLSEFDDARFDDTVWQIGARLLGPVFRRAPEQPASDDPGSPFGPTSGQFYLRQPTDRGLIVSCAFEFYEYTFVRGPGGPAAAAMVQTSRDYFQARGWTCGG